MQRWIVILSLALVQWPNFAVASPKTEDVPLWKRVLSVFTPAARPAHHDRKQSTAAAAAPISTEPAAESRIHGPRTKSSGSDAGCNGGKRIISAYYWQGQHTASGEPFNPHDMTAAHRTLPFGTRLTVTNPRNGKSVIVVVNDRGPFVSGVNLDLSLGAAQAIGMHGTGAVCIL